VLRKILRRAARHGKMLGLNDPFLYQLTGKVAEIMSDAYPELLESMQHVAKVVKSEEQRFAHTMTVALQEFEKVVREVTHERSERSEPLPFHSVDGSTFLLALPGKEFFRLYDTFGMPIDWIIELANERGFTVDEVGFLEEMARQRERARAGWKVAEKVALSSLYGMFLQEDPEKPGFFREFRESPTLFEGYKETTTKNCVVRSLIIHSDRDLDPRLERAIREDIMREGGIPVGGGRSWQSVEKISPGTRAELALDHTPFYAEAGGQIGDTGWLLVDDSQEEVAVVEDTKSPVSGLILHKVLAKADIRVGDRLTAIVDADKRRATMRNHTGTHLLNAALRQVLGTHVKQAGSVVDPDRLRFDFSHFASVSDDELQEIERLANDSIVRNAAVSTEVLDLDRALDSGALAFFGEKYPDRVRVVTVGSAQGAKDFFSKELCGGTHVSRTGDIGLLKVTSEGSISAGVRRVEAVTGERALQEFQTVTGLVHRIAASLKTSPAEVPEMVERLLEAQRQLEKQVEALKLKAAQAQLADVEQQVRSVKDVRVLAIRLEALDRAQLRSMADVLRQRLKSGVVVLATTDGSKDEGKVSLIAALTPDLTKRLHAGKIAQAVAKRLGGSGGGRPDIAEAGGKNVNILDSVLNEVLAIVGEMLQ
jgi:alanyl-tRNA synthetase